MTSTMTRTATRTSQSTRTPPMNLGRKKGSHVIINIGSNVDPILPRPIDGPCTTAIAFEPIAYTFIPPHPALRVVPAAVTGGNRGAIAAMHTYNKKGLSSSLSAASFSANWNRRETLRVVPTIPLKVVLESLQDYSIDLIMTDMQGHDFLAVSSVDLASFGVQRLITEVYMEDTVTYDGVRNDLCRDWLPEMTRQGYVYEGLSDALYPPGKNYTHMQGDLAEACAPQLAHAPNPEPGLSEQNAHWRLASITASTPSTRDTFYEYPSREAHTFSDAEYAQCAEF